MFLKPAENSATATDLDIVGVRTQAQDRASRILPIGKV